MFQAYFKDVFNGCLMDFSRMLEVTRVIQKNFKVVEKEVSKEFHMHYKGSSRKFQGCLNKVLRVFHKKFLGVSEKVHE